MVTHGVMYVSSNPYRHYTLNGGLNRGFESGVTILMMDNGIDLIGDCRVSGIGMLAEAGESSMTDTH